MPPPSTPRPRKPAASAPAGDGTKAATASPLRQLRASDLRAVARLATQATSGISRVAEGVHQSVLGTLGLPGGAEPGRARGKSLMGKLIALGYTEVQAKACLGAAMNLRQAMKIAARGQQD